MDIRAQLAKNGIEYSSASGLFTRNGKPITARRGNGYIAINCEGSQWYAHRLAWFLVNGVWPSGDIDHINRDKTDNRIANLREATRSENQRNHPITRANTSGFKGVRWNKAQGKWIAFMRIDKRPTYLGGFARIEDALAARRAAEDRDHKQFAYRGAP